MTTDPTPESVEALTSQELKLHLGEMTAQEERTARAAIRWATTTLSARLAEVEAINAKLGEQADKDQAFICNKIIENNELSARADAAEARLGEDRERCALNVDRAGWLIKDRDLLARWMREGHRVDAYGKVHPPLNEETPARN